jgi:alkylation response protein AidB-like acyl-CoA dehydrogenase
MLLWHRVLHKKGWIAPSWPKEFGGTGWSITQRYIWEQEAAAADTFPPLPFGLTMVGPVIYTFGTARQRERLLPPILSGDHWWCQGYSEPGAGSDLASLRTRAVRDGDHYIVNGHKTWTTLAQHGLDILPGAYRPQCETSRRHIVPADRYEVARRQCAADHHDRWRPRGQ